MLPIRDLLPTLRFPTITLLLILLNVAVYVGGFGTTQVNGTAAVNADLWAWQYGAIPCEVVGHCDVTRGKVHVDSASSTSDALVDVPHVPAALTLLTSAFVHGGLLHLGGNMLFLWVFGNNVEDALGRIPFLLWYLVAAVVSGLGQVFIDTASDLPAIGASGAIAATIGAYLVLYPRARVVTWVLPPIPIFLKFPAWLVAGLWGVLQVVAVSKQLYAPPGVGAPSGGVAVMAHVTGFAFGLLTIRMLTRPTSVYEQMYGTPQVSHTSRPGGMAPLPPQPRGLQPSMRPHPRPAMPQGAPPQSGVGHRGPVDYHR